MEKIMVKGVLLSLMASVQMVLVNLYGNNTDVLKILAVIMAIDYVTGVMCAVVKKELSSRTGAIGLAKKLVTLSIIAMCHMVDVALGRDILMQFSVLFYISNEGISLIENAGRLGIPVPEKVKNAIKALKEDN